MQGQDQRRVPLPAALSPPERDFVLELRRLVDVAGLTFRGLEVATSSAASDTGEPSFYSKSRWGRWLNGQAQPPRKAIRKLADKLDGEEISAGHLLDLWDAAFAAVAQAGAATGAAQAPVPQPSEHGAAGQITVPPGEPGHSQHDQAASRLASLVARECTAELSDRVLRGWQPLAVRWRLYTGPDADNEVTPEAPAGDTGNVGPLASYLQRGHRLVVLGPGGAGKTTLATLLMDELLVNREPGDPVPVIIPAVSMTPGEMVKTWLERSLADRYPSLRDARAYGPHAAEDLVARERILPVIDGLDELTPGARGTLLSALSRAFGRRQPLILTCRPDEYHEAVESCGHVLPGGAIIVLQPVAAEAAASFLERGTAGAHAGSWHRVATALRAQPAGPLAQALSSPLMVALVRSWTDGGTRAAELTGQADQAAIEHGILQGLIDATFSSRATSEDARPRLRWSSASAARWLMFLAGHLTWIGSYELDWPRLRYALPAFTSPLRRAALSALIAAVAAGVMFGLSRGLTFGAYQGLLYALAHALDVALVVGAVYLLAPLSYPPGARWPPWLLRLRRLTRTPLRTTLAIPAAYALESGIRDGIGAGRVHGIWPGVREGLIAAALNWLVAAILVWLAARAKLFNLAEKPVYFSLRVPGRAREFARTMVIGVAWGAGLGLIIGYGVMILGSMLALEHPLWGLGIAAGAVIGAAFALVQWGRTPVASAPAVSPLSAVRADRNLVLVLAVPFLAVLPVVFGAGFGTGNGTVFLTHILYGLGIGLTVWLVLALSHAWPQYLITTAGLAIRGRVPWRLAAFLSEARELEILRQRGDVYLFRHARLQDHLAMEAASRGAGWSRRRAAAARRHG